MYLPLDGPALNEALSVSSAVEVKAGASKLDERKVITIQPIDGDIWFGFSSSDLSTKGSLIKQGQYFLLACSAQPAAYVHADSGTVDVRISEIA